MCVITNYFCFLLLTSLLWSDCSILNKAFLPFLSHRHENYRKSFLCILVYFFTVYNSCLFHDFFSLEHQGRSQPFCMEGFLMYIACPFDNWAPEALFTRGFRGHTPPEIFLILGLQKWRLLDFEHKFPITSALNVVSISNVNYLLLVKNPLIERCILLL